LPNTSWFPLSPAEHLVTVAKRFAATWEQGSGPPDAYLMVAGKRVAVDIRTLKRRGAGHGNAARPRLRFDKVATRLMERLRTTLADIVPDGTTVVLTVTAPIRVPAKTAAALEDKIHTLLARRSPGRDEKATVNGNRVRIRVLRNQSERAPKFIGFVHNADTDPLLLLNMTGEWLELIGAEAGRRATKRADDRWLVVMSAGERVLLDACRDTYAQLRMATGFTKVLIVFGDGRVGELTG
jgi:hypothetical protein